MDCLKGIDAFRQVRPENNQFSHFEAEGFEISHLRTMYRSMGITLPESELAAKAHALKSAVRAGVNKLEEANRSPDVEAIRNQK
jgi:hypothetical protein